MGHQLRTSLYGLYREMVDSHLDRLDELMTEQSRRIAEHEAWPGVHSEDELTVHHVRGLLTLRGEAAQTFREMVKEACSAVIFACMTAEAFINDYAVLNLSSGYVKDHLNGLRTKSNWLVIPRLVTGKQLNPGGSAMHLYDRLVDVRNNLVHYKAKWVQDDAKPADDPLLKNLFEAAESAPRALLALAEELDAIDPTAKAQESFGLSGLRTLNRWVPR